MSDLTPREGRIEALAADVQRFRTEWEQLGCPSTTMGSRGTLVTHPLVNIIRNAEQMLWRMESNPAATPGRKPGQQSAPDRVGEPSRRTKLKVVGNDN